MTCPLCGSKRWSRPVIYKGGEFMGRIWDKRHCSDCSHEYQDPKECCGEDLKDEWDFCPFCGGMRL